MAIPCPIGIAHAHAPATAMPYAVVQGDVTNAVPVAVAQVTACARDMATTPAAVSLHAKAYAESRMAPGAIALAATFPFRGHQLRNQVPEVTHPEPHNPRRR